MRAMKKSLTAIVGAVLAGALAGLARGMRQPGPLLPGDRLVRAPVATRTLSAWFPAGPDAVWPWLAQMGAGRAGWYGVDLIDNGGEASADRIVPELQRIAPGDELAASTFGGPPFVVAQAVEERALVMVLRSGRGRLRTSYAYVLAPQAGGTRLTARLRMGGRPALGAMLAAPLVLAGHEAGQRIQFLRLRRRISAR